MRIVITFLLFFTVFGSGFQNQSEVWNLIDSNFQEAISSQNLLILFYSPWCDYSKILLKDYSKAAKSLSILTPPIKIAQIDTSINKLTPPRFDIFETPTILYFINKVPTKYSGEPTENSIFHWILRKNSVGLIKAKTPEILSKHIKTHSVSLVYFLENPNENLKTFEYASETLEGAVFIHSAASEALKLHKTTEGSLVLFTQFETKRFEFLSDFSQNEILQFISKHNRPKVFKFSQLAMSLIFKDYNPAIFLLSSNYSKYSEFFVKLSHYYKFLVFCEADLNPENSILSKFLSLEQQDQPVVVIINPAKPLEKYKLEGRITEDNIEKFIKLWREKKLLPYYKSQKLENEFENSVKVLVGNTFEKNVFDLSKDVVVMFYNKWSKSYSEILEILERLANEFKENNTLVIAKINTAENEIQGEVLSRVTSIKIYPGNNKKPVEYFGQKNLDGIRSFIEKNLYFPLNNREKTDL